jgi:hypothetical protein
MLQRLRTRETGDESTVFTGGDSMMLMAKVIALAGLVLFAGGATGALAVTSLAIGSVLLLMGATVAAVALEGRDLEDAAGLIPHPADEADAAVIPLPGPAVHRAA